MSETLSQIITWVGGILGGISVSGIINALYTTLKLRKIQRWIEKNNNQMTAAAIGEKAVEKSVDRIKEVGFKQNIQPVLDSGLEKVNEKSAEFIKQELAATQARYEKLIEVIKALAAYFDNSIGVSEEAKENLRNAIADAEIKPEIEETSEVNEIVVEEEKADKKSKSTVKVER